MYSYESTEYKSMLTAVVTLGLRVGLTSLACCNIAKNGCFTFFIIIIIIIINF